MKRVPVDELKSEWSEIEVWVDTFCKRYPEHDKYDLVYHLMTGKAHLWKDDNVFVYGMPGDLPHRFFLLAVGGSKAETWADSYAKVEEDIKEMGFTEIETISRHGMVPFMKSMGFKSKAVLLKKEI